MLSECLYLHTAPMRYKYPSLSQHSYRANNMVNRAVLDDMAGGDYIEYLVKWLYR